MAQHRHHRLSARGISINTATPEYDSASSSHYTVSLNPNHIVDETYRISNTIMLVQEPITLGVIYPDQPLNLVLILVNCFIELKVFIKLIIRQSLQGIRFIGQDHLIVSTAKTRYGS
jgi:hypothetical protein